MGQRFQKVFALVFALIICVNLLTVPAFASAAHDRLEVLHNYGLLGYFNSWISGTRQYQDVPSSSSSGGYAANNPQNYYTTLTSSVQDKYGNVTNYYRGGDTTNTNIIDSYNKTFNTIWNTTNNSTTNNYSANVKLDNFLNQYTTNNNNYTYSADFKSWYYDNTTNNYNYSEFNKYDYTQNNLYYNQDNSRYYISIDNSTDEYYLIDVQYSPTFVTVNYTYNTTNNYNEKVGDVTNVYYYELKDGRNSYTLTANEVAGLDTGYDVANYVLVADDPNTLSLQHFDGDYTDSSSYNRTFYSQNRSMNYVDSGAFGKAVALPNGSAAGVTIPGLSSNSNLTFDFRVYFNDISSLGIYFGDTNIFGEVVPFREWNLYSPYDDNSKIAPESIFLGPSVVLMQGGVYMYPINGTGMPEVGKRYTLSELSAFLGQSVNYQWSDTLWGTTHVLDDGTEVDLPTSFNSPGFLPETGKKYGWMISSGTPSLYSSINVRSFECTKVLKHITTGIWGAQFRCRNRLDRIYRWSPSQYVVANFAYDNYKNQWVSMRVTISGGKLYYFINGDLVGSGTFTKPSTDKFYIKSSGTVYLDELRVTTGSLSSTGTYNPSNSPYDTNKVLALPDKLTANTIYVQNNIQVTNNRIGGVRPSNPEKGFLYIPLHDDRTAAQPQLYDGSNWIDVNAMVHNGNTTVNVLGYKFSPVGDSPDIDIDAKPERPPKPSDDPDPETCSHDWVEYLPDCVEPTCTLAGVKTYICSKCEKRKLETLPLLDHDWMVKVAITNQYDETGELIVVGFTIYECTRCQEQYKSIDGTAPPPLNSGGSSSTTPGGSSGDEGEEKEGFLGWLLRKAGELLGAVGNGVIGLIKAALGKIFDGLIDLVNMVFEKLSQLVNLFGSFGDALGVLWTWLPPEIMTVLVAGVTVFVFIGLIKLFMK